MRFRRGSGALTGVPQEFRSSQRKLAWNSWAEPPFGLGAGCLRVDYEDALFTEAGRYPPQWRQPITRVPDARKRFGIRAKMSGGARAGLEPATRCLERSRSRALCRRANSLARSLSLLIAVRRQSFEFEPRITFHLVTTAIRGEMFWGLVVLGELADTTQLLDVLRDSGSRMIGYP
jgi:hypothetical protein